VNDTPPLDEIKLLELMALRDAARDEIAATDCVCKAVEVALGRIARERYPGLGNWEPEQLRKLGECISWHASRFAGELSDLGYPARHPG